MQLVKQQKSVPAPSGARECNGASGAALCRRALTLGVLFLALVAAPLAAQTATVEAASGKVEYRTNGSWTPVEVGDQLPVGATISTGFGASAELAIGESTINVDQLTRMTVEELARDADVDRTELSMPVGKVRAEVRTAERRQEFTVTSPIATAAVRGTRFTFDTVTVEVEDDTVSFGNQYGRTVTVRTGEQSQTSAYTPPAPPKVTRQARSRVSESTDTGDGESDDGDDSGGFDPSEDTPIVSEPEPEPQEPTDEEPAEEEPDDTDDTGDTGDTAGDTGTVTITIEQ